MAKENQEMLDIEWWKWILFVELRRAHEFAGSSDGRIAGESRVRRAVYLDLLDQVFSRHGLKQSEYEELRRIRREAYPEQYK